MKATQVVKVLSIVSAIASSSLYGQGSIRGVVSDSLTNDLLPGANVYLPGTSLGSATNLDGLYRIDRIPQGNYTLRTSYLGYQSEDIEVFVENAKTLVVNIKLQPETIQGDVVVITGQAEGQVAAINQQLSAETIVNVISEEKIQELPDANAAEAIGRLPGVSIRRSGGEANRVVLRGLSDQFSVITIDGVRIPPTDAEERGVDLSTISQGSLAGIELYKALTPDKDADAIAGAVNLVTRKAPVDGLFRVEAKGAYDDLEESASQYDLRLRYGSRFLENMLGVQLSANLEQRIRSSERIDFDYDQSLNNSTDYQIDEFILQFSDEKRKRNAIGLVLDFDTPDDGSIKLNTVWNKTKRDFIVYERNYVSGGSDDLEYGARDREQEISTFNSFINGQNNLPGFRADWSLGYGKSKSDFPYDYEVTFLEPSAADPETGEQIARMLPVPQEDRKDPALIMPRALNNFAFSYFNTANFRNERNEDTEKTAFLNLSKDYLLGSQLSGSLKFGGKFRSKSRFRARSDLFSPYYNVAISNFVRLPDGTIQPKDYTGTLFENFQASGSNILFTNFLPANPKGRDLFGRFALFPLLNRSALRQWYELNQNAVFGEEGRGGPEYRVNREAEGAFYDLTERVTAGYVMNTLNFGQRVTWVAGLRVERENNDYASRYAPGNLSGFPVPAGSLVDTSATFNETVWLPNTHLTVRATDFMNIRLAAYRALARPNFDFRLERFIAKSAGTFYPGNSLTIGNPGLRAAKAWNFELNTSFYSNKIGLFSVSIFHKNIEDMFQTLNGLPFNDGVALATGRPTALDSLGINYENPFEVTQYALTYTQNAREPTKVWGLEVEHQMNLSSWPGFLKHAIVSYNFSLVNSETFIPRTTIVRDTSLVEIFPGIFNEVITVGFEGDTEDKQKLSGQPEFFGNVALGYDVAGFSARLSLFHQGEFNTSFSTNGRSDGVQNSFTRLDLSLKQKISKNISVLLNINNLTNTEEGTSLKNREQMWVLENVTERFGTTADLGLRIEL